MDRLVRHVHPALDAKVGEELKELAKLIDDKLVIVVTGPMDGYAVFDSGQPEAVALLEATARRISAATARSATISPIVSKVELFDYNGRVYGPVQVIKPTQEDSRSQMLLDKEAAIEKRRKEVMAKAQSLGLTVEELEILRRQ